jgi:transmembrane sensor
LKKNNKDLEKELKSAWEADYKEVSEKKIKESFFRFHRQLTACDRRKRKQLYFRYSGIAATFLLLFLGYFYVEVYNPVIRVVNNSAIEKEITLPDGSLVILEANSEISYPEKFKQERGVTMRGHAFFEVVKDSLKEFKVKTENLTITVLGTTFTVNEPSKEKKIKVSLYSGRVLISPNGNSQSWAIIPGESFVYEAGRAFIEEFQTNFSFNGKDFVDVNNVELEKLLDFLSERFNYTFEKNSYTKNKRVTLRINKSDSLKQILNILSIINKTNYEMNYAERKVKISRKEKEPTTVK